MSPVRVLICPGMMHPVLPVVDVAALLDEGWVLGAPADQVDVVALDPADLIGSVQRSSGLSEAVPVVVQGAGGENTPATMLRLPDGTVVVELAQVLGEQAGGRSDGDSSAALDLLTAAMELAPSRLVVGVAGIETRDAGAGLLSVLGEASLDEPDALRVGGTDLANLSRTQVSGLNDAVTRWRDRFAGVELVVAVDQEMPLLGLHGANAWAGMGGGVSLQLASQTQQVERAFGHWTGLLSGELGADRVRGAAQGAGAGAGGGLPFALGLLGGVLRPAAKVIAELVDLRSRVGEADLVLTAVGVLDPDSVGDTTLGLCAGLAAEAAVPVVVISGESVMGRRECAAAGFAGVYPLSDGTVDWTDLEVPRAVTERTRRVARTWSR